MINKSLNYGNEIGKFGILVSESPHHLVMYLWLQVFKFILLDISKVKSKVICLLLCLILL